MDTILKKTPQSPRWRRANGEVKTDGMIAEVAMGAGQADVERDLRSVERPNARRIAQ
jgi:hypothetical protein